MSRALAGTRVTLVDPNYKTRTNGVLLHNSALGVYGTYTLSTQDNSLFRSEGVLELETPIPYIASTTKPTDKN